MNSCLFLYTLQSRTYHGMGGCLSMDLKVCPQPDVYNTG